MLLTAGCGGGSSDKKANEAYANGVCSAIGDWTKQVKSVATDFSGGISHASLDAKLSQIETATKTLASQIKAVPPPNSSQGQTAKKQIDQFVSEAQTTVAAAKSTVAKLPANATVSQTLSALSSLAPQVKSLASSAQSTLKAVQTAHGSLASAFENASACKNLTH
jgi:hypothetical protein